MAPIENNPIERVLNCERVRQEKEETLRSSRRWAIISLVALAIFGTLLATGIMALTRTISVGEPFGPLCTIFGGIGTASVLIGSVAALVISGCCKSENNIIRARYRNALDCIERSKHCEDFERPTCLKEARSWYMQVVDPRICGKILNSFLLTVINNEMQQHNLQPIGPLDLDDMETGRGSTFV